MAFWVEYQPWESGDFNEAISMQKLKKPVYKIKNPKKTSLSAFYVFRAILERPCRVVILSKNTGFSVNPEQDKTVTYITTYMDLQLIKQYISILRWSCYRHL